MVKQTVIILQTAIIIAMTVIVFKMKANVDKTIVLINQANKNAQDAIRETKIAQDNEQKAIDISHKLTDKIKAYEQAYGPILMPGESMQLSFQIPIR